MSYPFQPSIDERRTRWLRVRAKYKWRDRLLRNGCVIKVTLPQDLRFGDHQGLLVIELADGNKVRMKIPDGDILLETPIF